MNFIIKNFAKDSAILLLLVPCKNAGANALNMQYQTQNRYYIHLKANFPKNIV